MSYQVRGKDLRVKFFRSSTLKELESNINTWLANSEDEFEIIDITYQRYFNPLTEKTISTAMVVFQIV